MNKLIFAGLVLGAAFSTGVANAHEILLLPKQADGKLQVTIESTHVFAKPEELEAAENLAVYMQTAEGKTDMAVSVGGKLSLKAEGDAPAGAAWVVAHRLPLVFSNTPSGYQPGGKDKNLDA